MTNFSLKDILIILLIIWGLPFAIYRSKFRKIVYNTDSWLINIKPVFTKEIKALFGNIYPEDAKYKRFRNFYRFYISVYIILFILYFSINFNNTKNNTNNMSKIEVGSTIPSFSAQDQNGNIFNIESVLGKKNIVIYFYPKDDSPGCTKQACSFRDNFEDFKDAEAEVIGISHQSVESHLEFAKKHRLNFTLLSDEDKKITNLFQVPTNFMGFIPGRVTYVVNKEGKVVYMFNSQIQAEKHVQEAIRILKELK